MDLKITVEAMEKPKFDPEERTFLFAQEIRKFIKQLPMNLQNQEDCRQLIRASGSIGANYIEANGALGKKDFVMHLRISRKEAKESRYWLRLIDTDAEPKLNATRNMLVQEATELMNIFSSIVKNSDSPSR